MNVKETDAMARRMGDGRVLLTVPEAAALWQAIGNIAMSPGVYRRRCKAGVMRDLGVDVSEGPPFLTDLDSLLAYFDRELRAMCVRCDEALAGRREELARRAES